MKYMLVKESLGSFGDSNINSASNSVIGRKQMRVL